MGQAIKALAGSVLTAGAFLGPVGLIGIPIALAFVGSKVAERKAKSALSSSFGTEVQLSGDPNDVRAICYGQAWTGGTLRFRKSIGVDNKDLYFVIVLAGHACDSVPLVKADRETLTLDGSGNVTSPTNWAGLINIRYVLGSDTQAADSTLDSTFTEWTSDHRLRGCTYAIVKLTFDEEKLRAPPAFRFFVKGRKVYDARLDSTNGGSGAHRLNDPTTWAWSNNAVLCANDFHRGIMINGIRIAGPGISSGRFHWPNVIAEANVCDENVALDAGGNENRYTVNGFIDPRQMHDENSEQFEQAFAGDFLFADGKWRYFAGAYRAPSLQLTADHFVGPLRMVVHKSESERRDTAHGRFQLSADGSTPNYKPLSLSTATVGAERPTTIDFPLVNDEADSGTDGGARAQRIAKLLLERDAAGKLIHCTTNLYGWRAVPGESIGITHAAFGLSTQTMRVMEVQLRPFHDGNKTGLVVDLTLAAGPESLYAWSAEETVIGAAPALPQNVIPWAGNGSWTSVLANVAQLGRTFTKVGGTNGVWDAGFYSQEGFEACAVSFRASQTDMSVAVGLNSDPTTDHDWDTIDYGISCETSGNLVWIESGASGSLGTYTTSDQLTVTYDGLTVRYYKNATRLRTKALVGARLFLDSAFLHTGAAVNSVTFGPITHVRPKAVGWAADRQGKPAGVVAVQGIADRSQVSLVDGCMRITSTPDSTVVYGLPAIPVDPGETYPITVKWKSSGSSADGLYLIAYEYGSALPSGKTHVGNGTPGTDMDARAVDATTIVDLVANAPMPGTTAVEHPAVYTPTAGTKFMTLGFGNFDPATASVSLDVAWAAMTELGSNVDKLPGVLPPVDRYGLNVNSATDPYQLTDAGWASSLLDVGIPTSGFFFTQEDILVQSIDIEAGEAVDVVVQILGGGTILESLTNSWTLALFIKAGDTSSFANGPKWTRVNSSASISEDIILAATFQAADTGVGSKSFGLKATLEGTGNAGGPDFDLTLADISVTLTHIKA